jgi:lipid II:glycine glycyltransferase (peptidoglycan interpeptide bridge formation enzyme)
VPGRSIATVLAPAERTLVTLELRPAVGADREAWSTFLAARPEGDVLQSWAWGEASAGEPGEHWARLVLSGPDGRIRAIAQVLDRRTSFGRTILYVPHGPVWEREAPDAAELLGRMLHGLRVHARSRKGVVLKLDPRASADATVNASLSRALLASGMRRPRHDLQAPTTRVIALEPGADPVAGWAKDARAELRRAEREGVTARVVRDLDAGALDAFAGLLEETSDRQAFRARSHSFLVALARSLSPNGDWFLALAEHEGRLLAGAVAPRTGDRGWYLYAASTRDPDLARKRGPYAVMGALLRAHRDAGTRSFDLWGVRERDDPTVNVAWEGFSLFKRRFGGMPVRHPGTFDLVIDPFWHTIRDVRERLMDLRR